MNHEGRFKKKKNDFILELSNFNYFLYKGLHFQLQK